MTARDFLELVRDASVDLERCRQQLEVLEHRAQGVSASPLGSRVSGTPSRDKLERDVVSLVSRETHLQSRIDADYETIATCSKMLYGPHEDGSGGLCAHLAPSYSDIIYLRYCSNEPWKRVSRALDIGIRTCQVMLCTALEVLDERGLVPEVS